MKKILSFAIFACFIFGVGAGENYPFAWDAASNGAKLSITVNVPDNHYLYSELVEISVTDSAGTPLNILNKPSPEKYIDSSGTKNTIYPSGIHLWIYEITGSPPFSVNIKYQGCSKKPFLCYPPSEKNIEIDGGLLQRTANTISSTGKNVVKIFPSPNAKIANIDEESFLGKIIKKGRWWIFIAAFLGGALSVLTPCVLPLVPITMAIFSGKGKENETVGIPIFIKTIFYVAGIVLSFTVLAVLAAFSGRTFGAQLLGNSIVVMMFAIVFFILSLSMLGLYELQLPSFLQTKLSSMGGGKGFGPFLMGLAAGIIAVPCTGPVLAALLGVAAGSGNPIFSVFLLASYACGFGAPFLILGLGIGKVPKSGIFMERIKSLLGIAIMVIAFYAFSIPVKSFDKFLIAGMEGAKFISIFCIIIGFLLGAVHADGHSPQIAVRFAKIAGAILLSFGIVWNLKTEISAGTSAKEKISWTFSIEDAVNKAPKMGKNILIDFGAEWCAACKEMDAITFADDAVIDEISKNWLAVKVDGTVNTPDILELQKKYEVSGYPHFVVLSPWGRIKGVFTGFYPPEKFLKKILFLKEETKGSK
jgi:thiol:disulfide interchange protein DsbD